MRRLRRKLSRCITRRRCALERRTAASSDSARLFGYASERLTTVTALVTSLFIIGLDDPAAKQHLRHHGKEASTSQRTLRIGRDFLSSREIEAQIRTSTSVNASELQTVDAIVKFSQSLPPRRVAERVSCEMGCRYHPEEKCIATTITCLKCKKVGHCPNACPKRVHEIEEPLETPDSDDISCDELRPYALRLHELRGHLHPKEYIC